MEMLSPLLFADIDPQLWFIIIMAIASAIGGIFTKKKSEEGKPDKPKLPDRQRRREQTQQKSRPAEPPRRREPVAQSRPAEPVRRPEPPPARPAQRRPAPPPEPEPFQPAPTRKPGAVAERVRQREQQREATRAYEETRRQAAEIAETRQRQREAEHHAFPEALPAEKTLAEVVPAHGDVRAALRQLLRNRNNLRAAIVMSEVLGPPKALRRQVDDNVL